jgi:nucleotide-binding universal stress UspA family protein
MDFSPGSLRAFPFATGIALHFGSKLFVAHISPPEDYDAMPLTEQSSMDKLLETAAEAGLSDAAGHLREIPHQLLFEHGGISARLLQTAEKCKVDLIVIGTHGWRGIKKLLKGSTAEEIACLASKPVLMVGPGVSSQPDFKVLLYATDFLPPAVHAISYAVSLARVYGSNLLIIHVNNWNSQESPGEAGSKTSIFLREYLSKYDSKEVPKVPEVIVDFGPPVDRILEHAAARKVDLIIMGLHQRNNIRARIAAHLPGSTVYEVVSQAHCPVLTVPLAKPTAAGVTNNRP